jgi:hypothetical protein
MMSPARPRNPGDGKAGKVIELPLQEGIPGTLSAVTDASEPTLLFNWTSGGGIEPSETRGYLPWGNNSASASPSLLALPPSAARTQSPVSCAL